jgi:hypothetical protein
MSVSVRGWAAALACLVMLACAPTITTEPAALNTLTAAERADGWRLLFDGHSTAGWRNFKSAGIDPRWQAADGALTVTAAGGGDIITTDQFENFELQFEWRIAPAGNSGVFFNVVEGDHDTIWRTGPEMQILDDARHSDGALPSHRAGANYDLHSARVPAARPVGEFNHVRLIVNRGHVQQWLNGELVVEYDLWTPEWEALVAASKFADMPDYGRAHSGHIALQDHGDRVWFRNIKIKPL